VGYLLGKERLGCEDLFAMPFNVEFMNAREYTSIILAYASHNFMLV
jgi:hypothetical protein